MLIGQATGGVALFLTGLILSSQPLLLDRNVISGALLKNVAQPLFVAGLIIFLPMHKDTGPRRDSADRPAVRLLWCAVRPALRCPVPRGWLYLDRQHDIERLTPRRRR